MYKNILVPILFDHDPSHKQALAIAHSLVGTGGEITLLHVVEQLPGYIVSQMPAGMLESTEAEARNKLEAIAEQASDQVQAIVKLGHSSRTILAQADTSNADCIIISSHQPGLGDYLLGSTAARVVRHAKCAVHVLR